MTQYQHELTVFRLAFDNFTKRLADNSQFPQQAGTSAIPQKRKALPLFPTCREMDKLEEVLFFKCHGQFCMDLHSSSIRGKAESKPAKLTRDPLAKKGVAVFPEETCI